MQKEFDKNLKDLNTFKTDISAKRFITIESIQDIKELINEGIFEQPFYILGGGSNTLFTKDFDGTVIKVNLLGKEIIQETDDYIILKTNAGEEWHSVVEWTVNNNWLGAQNLALIPGTTGAAPVQNIGAYGSEIKDILQSVEIIDLKTGELSTLNNPDCNFSYRNSIFKNKLKNKVLITSITLKLEKLTEEAEVPKKYLEYGEIQKELEDNFGKPYTIQKVFNAICNIRKDKLPSVEEYGSCGSTFQNPVIAKNKYNELLTKYPELPSFDTDTPDSVKIPAAYILEKLGWKNKRLENSNCGTWIKHPLIVTNYGNATGEEIYSLIQKIQDDFQEDTGVKLDTEINII